MSHWKKHRDLFLSCKCGLSSVATKGKYNENTKSNENTYACNTMKYKLIYILHTF